ncbi:hypothetical protein [Lentilactobacillus hilgardii]|uniref:hypothetical protein n=1 Tax=Lentilactobacillus hilgardii TaxID=1588 RepID=UPI003FA5FCED
MAEFSFVFFARRWKNQLGMRISREETLAYLDSQSEESKIIRGFLKQLESMVQNWVAGGHYQLNDSDLLFDTDFKKLLTTMQGMHTEFIPYSEVTRIIYNNNDDGLDAFFMKLNQKIMENVKLEDSPEIANEYVVLIKSVEHMKLANKQMDNLYKKQQDKLNQQQEKINVLEKNISKTKKRYKKLNKMKGSLYGDFIAILGIFAAVIFTLFGGLLTVSRVVAQMANGDRIYRIMISVSLLGIVLIGLLFFLLKAVATMSDKSISINDIKKLYDRYPFFMWSLTIMVGVFVLGLIVDFLSHI